MAEFEPSRLTLARQRRALTKKALAESVGVSAQAITAFEKGTYSPEPDKLIALATSLGVSGAQLCSSELELLDADRVSFRARRAMSARLRNKMLASARWIGASSEFFRRRFALPELAIPDLRGEAAAAAAALVRCEWKLGEGPIDNVVHLLESKGVECYWLAEDSSTVDAYSYWDDDRPYVLFNLFKQAGERGRFDGAHELGHLVLHRGMETQGREREAEADEFAAHFLMPEAQFRVECPRYPNWGELLKLKPRWRTSLQAMVRRGRDVGLFSQWQYERACRDLSAKGWRKGEPGELPREESALHSLMVSRLLDRRVDIDDVEQETGIPRLDLIEFVPEFRRLPAREGVTPYGRIVTKRGNLTLMEF